MTGAIRRLVVLIARQAVLWIVDALALGIAAWLLPGFDLVGTPDTPAWLLAIATAFVLGLVNFMIRPVILVIARPLGMIALLLVGYLVNAITLLIAAALLPGFTVDGLWAAFVGGLLFTVVNTLVTSLMELDEEGSYYQGRMERWAAREPFEGADEPGVGLVMIEVDGLSVHHMQHAMDAGLVPTIAEMIREDGYSLSKVDCGIPSQTSACQAGIMFGDNHDIPAFRWYDKDEGRLYVSSSDAGDINSRYAKGEGLMRGGSSIDNMMNGDAEKSMLTLADLMSRDRDTRKRRAKDVYLLALNPYFLSRTLVLTFASVGRELWEGWRQRRNNVYPRLNRLAHFYPFVRAGTSVFVRDLAAHLTVLDIIRGAPAIYVTWPGYDEVAHHSGPWTQDAFGELARFDAVIDRVRRVIRDKAPRPYELIILSDHGQSFGPTFLQRYGMTLKEFIERQLPEGTTVSQSIGGDTGITTLSAAGAELENASQEGAGGSIGRAVSKQGQKAIQRGVREADVGATVERANVTAYGSGNLAQVYFDLFDRRITIPELQEAFPGMVDALVSHEGIGFLAGYDGDGVPVVLGKGGSRNLHTDEVTGEDPLAPFAPEDGYGVATLEKRAWQVRRVMDFPHAGDLMVNSAVFPDGTVAALEELIGSHGGMGGEQMDAFILHPPTVEVPDTRNSTDVFHILNGRRGGAPAEPVQPPPESAAESWAPRNLGVGAMRVRHWGATALRCLMLDRAGFERAASDPSLTGPSVLLALVGLTVTSLALRDTFEYWRIPLVFALWAAATVAVWAAGVALTRQGTYPKYFRATAFAQMVHSILLLSFLPVVGSVVRFLGLLMGLVATWLAVAAASNTRGARALAVGALGVVIVVVGLAVAEILIAGAALGLDAMLQQLGIHTAG